MPVFGDLSPAVRKQTLADLGDDFAELHWLATSAAERLATFADQVTDVTTHPATQQLLQKQITELSAAYKNVIHDLSDAQTQCVEWQTASLRGLLDCKDRSSNTLRDLQGITAATITATDWQSPSFLSSMRSQAGRHTGRIAPTITDYQRFYHHDAEVYEKAFREAYIDAACRFPPKVYAAASGMSAFSTAVTSLHNDGRVNGNVLVGRGCYFENKHVLYGFFAGRVHEVNEMRIDEVLAAVEQLQPALIALDSLCNTEEVQLPNLTQLLPAIAKRIRRPTIIVLDNTGLATTFQPLVHLPRGSKLQLVVIESLVKYHQFGLDRVMGGVLWRNGIWPASFFATRERLGTILPATSVLTLPPPNRTLLTKRLSRLERNAMYLAKRLESYCQAHTHSAISHVVYPGLASYQGPPWTRQIPFHGSFFVLRLKPLFARPVVYRHFVQLVINEAAKVGIQVTSGSSFGFANSRLYVTALHAKGHAKPFLRISVGTETQAEIALLGAIFEKTMDSLKLPFFNE